MTLTPRVRKLALTTHIASSVGWLGAVVTFLALAVAGLTTEDAQLVHAVSLTMELIGWFVLVPLSLASLLSGLVQSVGTRWGVFRHYWVVAKLLITVLSTVVLLLYMQSLGSLADRAAETSSTGGPGELRNPSAALHTGAALLLLLAATTLSVYKPAGVTRYGRRPQEPSEAGGPRLR